MSTPERREPPWPYYTQRQAATVLGVSVDFIHGLHGHDLHGQRRQLRAMKSATPKGNWITLYNREDVDALAARMEEEAP